MFVTSSVGHQVRAYWATYAVSKAALEMVVKIYAAEVGKTRLKVNLIDPGRTRTRMRAKAYPGEDPMTLKTPDEITDTFVALAEPACARHGETVTVQPARSPA
jgi:NAD(P)-dependent dehydrogenase (short-subunit alcohol dehydrogenase family)